jgi:hypothetical protein
MPDLDFFRFFRNALATIATVYATVITLQSLWGWYVILAASDKYTSLLRRYLLVQSLRLRFKTFWGDVIVCALLFVAFAIIWHAQTTMDDVERTLTSAAKVRTVVRR